MRRTPADTALPRLSFVYPDATVRTFWMKNTLINLDMLFLSNEYTVLHIIEDVPKMTTEARSSELPAQYVVELAAGEVRRHGIHIGDTLRLE